MRMLQSAPLVTLAYALGLAACGGTQSVGARYTGESVELPVRRVVLYQNGVGYFERRGKLDGDVLTLQVRPDQVNDILKSLTVLDLNEGRAVSVSLPLEKRGADVLAELPEQVRNAGGLIQVLAAFRGARVRIDGRLGEREGRVVGVEPRGGDTGGLQVTLKHDDGTLSVYPTEKVEEVELADRTLVVGLDRSLDVSLDAGNWKPLALQVRLTGASSHDLLVSYISEMPLWKPSYRVVVRGGGKALVQGWAVIDNVSGGDWEQAKLSLVAGNPVSFKYDLHSPQFMQRRDLTPHHRQMAAAPVIERAGVGNAPPPPAMEMAAPMSEPRLSATAPSAPQRQRSMTKESKKSAARYDDDEGLSQVMMSKDEAAPDMGAALEAQAVSNATGESVGALYRYDLIDPVTIPDGTSNLVSIVNANVAGDEVVLFRPGDNDASGMPRAYRAVKLTNATGSMLERGPVAIYSDNTFVGEAFVDRMDKGTTSFLTYAIDGTVALTQSENTVEEGGRLLKILAGMLQSEVMQVRKVKLMVKNDGAEAITAYVKTHQMPGWKLRNAPKDIVETPQFMFVPVPAAAKQTGKLELEWQHPVQRQISIDTDLATTALKLYLGSGKVPRELEPAIQELLRIKEKLANNASESERLERQRDQLAADQERVRDNLNLLRRTSGNDALQRQLVDKLGDLEQDLGKLSGRIVRLSDESAELARKMIEIVKGITLDTEGAPSK